MPRNRQFATTISTAGLCFFLSIAGCDRNNDQPSSSSRHSTASHAGTPQAENPPRSVASSALPESVPSTSDGGLQAAPSSTTSKPAENLPQFRPDDTRPVHDEKRLAEAGIHVYESRRLKLYTDLPEKDARPLTTLVDELYPAWEDYFGPLPPDRLGADFQMSGFVMRDMALFRGLGLIPDDLTFDHGSHLQNEFWLRDQEIDYYRRHLVIHEATHCFMTFVPGVDAQRWYLEGMAEYFGTHRLQQEILDAGAPIEKDGKVEFLVMPTSPRDFPGFGRISIIRKAFGENSARTIPSVMGLRSSEFISPEPYAWSWALCAFLDGTPRYRDRFRELSHFTRAGLFSAKFSEFFGPDERDLQTEWGLFVSNLQYGYDVKRAAIDFLPGEPLTDEHAEQELQIGADGGWQSTRVQCQKGVSYQITSTGKFSLKSGGEGSKPWDCEPQGISFRYFEGKPLGLLIGCIRPDEGTAEFGAQTMQQVISIGRGATIQAPISGTLYLRLNDAWNSLSDNHGHAIVTIRRASN